MRYGATTRVEVEDQTGAACNVAIGTRVLTVVIVVVYTEIQDVTISDPRDSEVHQIRHRAADRLVEPSQLLIIRIVQMLNRGIVAAGTWTLCEHRGVRRAYWAFYGRD